MEFLPEFTVQRPQSLEQAVRLAEEGNSRFLAGGTDLIPNLRRGIGAPKTLIDLSAITEMKEIFDTEDTLKIGGAVVLQQLRSNAQIQNDFRAVIEAAETIGSTTHSYMATVGGNLCLDTRCQYYNQSEWWRNANDYCLKYKGDTCHVAPQGNICRAAFSGDLAPALMIFEAQVELIGPEGRRVIALNDMYFEDGANSLTLKSGEILVSVSLTKLDGYQTGYRKMRVRGGIDFPLVGVAMAVDGNANNLVDMRVAVTGTNSRPISLMGTEDLLGRPLDEAALKKMEKRVFAQVKPMRSTFTAASYRRKVAINMTRRLALDLCDGVS